jgi:hypothetical protein
MVEIYKLLCSAEQKIEIYYPLNKTYLLLDHKHTTNMSHFVDYDLIHDNLSAMLDQDDSDDTKIRRLKRDLDMMYHLIRMSGEGLDLIKVYGSKLARITQRISERQPIEVVINIDPKFQSVEMLEQHGLAVQAETTDSIMRSIERVRETQKVGAGIIVRLEGQTQQLRQTDDNLDDINQSLAISSKTLKVMLSRFCCNRLMWLIMSLMIVAIIVLCVLKYYSVI